MFWREGALTLDYYVTDFVNQMVVDPYTNQGEVAIYNLRGESTSKSLQVGFNYEVFKRFDLRLAYKNDQVFTDYESGNRQKPLLPSFRGLVNLAYANRKENWKFDFTVQINGKSRLGVAEGEGELYHQGHQGHAPQVGTDNMTPQYYTLNGQITKIFNDRWECYLGVENLTDFRQDLPIIGFEEPFGTTFDATNVWGPVMGRKIYTGFRFNINKKNQE